MPGIGDWIGQPLSFVDNFLKQNSPTEYAEKISAFFAKKVAGSEESKQWIPSFNSTPVHDLKPNSLVRLRCMVQDMFGPEYYYDVFETENESTGEKKLQSGRFRDVTESIKVLHNSPATKTSERAVFYCVPVPAECDWVKQGYKATCSSPRAAGPSKQAATTKRSREDEEVMEVEGAAQVAENIKRTRGDGDGFGANGSNGSPVAAPTTMNFPLPGETGPAALIKLYDGLSETLKVNDIIEVYGVISTDPSLAHTSSDGCELFCEEEMKAHNPPSSLVPRLHAVHVNKLLSCNPLIDSSNLSNQRQTIERESRDIRENLLSILEHALCGDSLSAEYLLCHLLSSVYVRKDTIAVGKLSLNLTKVPSEDNSLISSLVELLQSFVTNLHYLPMSLHNMNKLRFVPTKDYDSNRLLSGILQLPDRVHLLLDEMAMQPGQLDVNGVRNLTALGNLMKWQTVSYDFTYHHQDFHTDVPVLTFSEGKSLLPSDVTIPLALDTQTSTVDRHKAIKEFLSPALLYKIRLYLTLIPTVEYALSEQMMQAVQDDFVGTRQANTDTMSAEDFQTLLVLSRLLAISYGQSDLTSELWSRAKLMEEERKHRLTH